MHNSINSVKWWDSNNTKYYENGYKKSFKKNIMSLIFPIFQSPTKKLLKYYYVLSIIFFFPKPCNSISRYFFVLSIKTFRIQITSLNSKRLKINFFNPLHDNVLLVTWFINKSYDLFKYVDGFPRNTGLRRFF